jgi:hypothetical protein
MGVESLAPQRIQAKYTRALAEIPLPVRSCSRIDPAALIVIGSTEIACRHPRLRRMTAP